jgi:hypothetical protein
LFLRFSFSRFSYFEVVSSSWSANRKHSNETTIKDGKQENVHCNSIYRDVSTIPLDAKEHPVSLQIILSDIVFLILVKKKENYLLR